MIRHRNRLDADGTEAGTRHGHYFPDAGLRRERTRPVGRQPTVGPVADDLHFQNLP